MKTYEAALSSTEWFEILSDNTSVFFDILGNKPVALNFAENGIPALDAPSVLVYPQKGGWDFQLSGVPLGQRLYAKATQDTIEIVVVR